MAFNLRQWSIALAAVAVVIAGGIYYVVSRPDRVVIEESAAPEATLAPPAATGGELMVAGPLGEQAQGQPNAPNIVIEYASMTCPHCQRWHSDVYPEFKKKYVDTGKAYFILREFPLDAVATTAIMLARCAPADRYFPIVDLLFDRQSDWAFVADPATALFQVVKQAGFSQDSFNACLTNQEILDGVNWVKNRASEKFDVGSTPTFFLNGEKRSGELLIEEIDKILGD